MPTAETTPDPTPAPTSGAASDPAPAPSPTPETQAPPPAAPPVAPVASDTPPAPPPPPAAPTIVADPFAGLPRPPAGLGVEGDGKIAMGPARAARLVEMIFTAWDSMGAPWFAFNWKQEIEAVPGLDDADRTSLALAMIEAAKLEKDDRKVLGPALVDRFAIMRVSAGFELWVALAFTVLSIRARVMLTLAVTAGPLAEAAAARKAAGTPPPPPPPPPAPKRPAPEQKPEKRPAPKKRGGKRKGAGRPRKVDADDEDETDRNARADGAAGDAA